MGGLHTRCDQMTPALVLTAVVTLPAALPAMWYTKTDTELRFTLGNHPITTYRYAGTVQAEKGTDELPLAKPFFYPLNVHMAGPPVTRDWPLKRGNPGETKDHFHQKSVWFCHGDVEPGWFKFEGKSADRRAGGVNFWTEAAGHGRIVCVEVGTPLTAGPSTLTIPTRNEWRTPDGRKILDETRQIGLSDRAPGILLSLDITLTASEGPVTFGDTKEGAMGVRVHDDLRTQAKKGAVVTSSDGTSSNAMKDDLPLWGKGADWHDYSGQVDGKPVGLAVFDHPENKPRAAWHTRAYGLMAANPFGRKGSKFPLYAGRTDLVTLTKGESLRLRYGVYAHHGDAKSGKVAEAFAGYTGR